MDMMETSMQMMDKRMGLMETSMQMMMERLLRRRPPVKETRQSP